MDPQIRNFKDFLQLYNRLTELCFSHCVDNFFNRDLSKDETNCVDGCLHKFTRVNQRIMGVYVEVQNSINIKRLGELEAIKLKQENDALAKAVEAVPDILTTETSQVSSIPSKVESSR